jgi:hypothetical protein
MNNVGTHHQFEDKFMSSINFIHEVKIFNEFQNDKKILIFDFRSREEYENRHMDSSVNIPIEEYSQDFFSCLDEQKITLIADTCTKDPEVKEMVKRYKRFFIVIIMSEDKINRKTIQEFESVSDEKERDVINKSLLFYKALIKNRVRELGLYNMGFKNFSDNYHFMTSGKNVKPMVQ